VIRILATFLFTFSLLAADTKRDSVTATKIDGVTGAAKVDGVTVTVGGGSTLNTDLIAFWDMDETVSGTTRADSEPTGTAQDLSASGVPDAPGKISNAATLNSNQYLSRADSADLSTGNIDFTWACWVKIASKTSDKYLIGKWDVGSAATKEYLLYYWQSQDRFSFAVSDGSSFGEATANNFGSPSTGTYYLVIGWHDSVNDIVGISVNAGTADTAAWSTGSVDTGTGLAMGALHGTGAGSAGTIVADIDEVGFWKKVLTSGERTELYNGGTGLTYPF
jgi:hypothetical protein